MLVTVKTELCRKMYERRINYTFCPYKNLFVFQEIYDSAVVV